MLTLLEQGCFEHGLYHGCLDHGCLDHGCQGVWRVFKSLTLSYAAPATLPSPPIPPQKNVFQIDFSVVYFFPRPCQIFLLFQSDLISVFGLPKLQR